MINPRFIALVTMVFAGAAMRLIPHPPNFAPIAAMALFGGAHFTQKRTAFLVPLLAMFVSDLIIVGGYHAMLPIVYGCFALTVCLGMLIRLKITPLTIGIAALSGSILFFIITNFGVWAVFSFYPRSLDGLIQCYVAAIPFFRNTIAGDLVFATILFGSFALAQKYIPAIRQNQSVKVNI